MLQIAAVCESGSAGGGVMGGEISQKRGRRTKIGVVRRAISIAREPPSTAGVGDAGVTNGPTGLETGGMAGNLGP